MVKNTDSIVPINSIQTMKCWWQALYFYHNFPRENYGNSQQKCCWASELVHVSQQRKIPSKQFKFDGSD